MIFNFNLIRDIEDLIVELRSGFSKLDLTENTESFKTSIKINPKAELRVPNQLRVAPTQYLIVSQEGNGLVTKSSTPWNDKSLYLKNNGNSAVKITVVFMK